MSKGCLEPVPQQELAVSVRRPPSRGPARDPDEVAGWIRRAQVVAILRLEVADEVVEICRVLAQSGLTVVEITADRSHAADSIAAVHDALGGEVLVGAGTVLDEETVAATAAAGASFCLSPHLDPALVRACRARDLLPIPGVLSPTEIVSAQALGLDLLKLFPCAGVGPEYLKALRGPFPTIDFVPTGGIELDDVEGWLRAGAAAVGLGSGLVGRGTLSAGDATAVLVRRAETVLEAVRKAGDSSSPLATSS